VLKAANALLDDTTPVVNWLAFRGFQGGGDNAWDIMPFYSAGAQGNVLPPGYHAGYGAWMHTATVNGKCYYVGSINYAMWGKIDRLCCDYFLAHGLGYDDDNPGLWSYENAISNASAWKRFHNHDTGLTCQQAEAFTAWGYKGTRIPDSLALPCKPSGDVLPATSLEWCWEPLIPRKGIKK
jgi:hypothetical protein